MPYVDADEACGRQQRPNFDPLFATDLDQERRAWLQSSCDALRDHAISREPVFAAVERQMRVERAHLRRQLGDDLGLDIGRIGDDKIELRHGRQRFAPRSDPQLEAVGNSIAHGVFARRGKRLVRDVGGDRMGLRRVHKDGDGDAAAAGAQV